MQCSTSAGKNPQPQTRVIGASSPTKPRVMGLVAAPPTPLLEAASTFRPRAPNLCGFKSAKIHERLSRRKSDFGRILPQISVGRKVLATVKAWKKICCGERQRSKSRDPSQFLRPCSFGQQRPGFPWRRHFFPKSGENVFSSGIQWLHFFGISLFIVSHLEFTS